MTNQPHQSGCLCRLDDLYHHAGPATRLCQHSNRRIVQQLYERLQENLYNHPVTIDPEAFFSTNIDALITSYMETTLGPEMMRNRTPQEHNILLINFMRHLALHAQAVMLSFILDPDTPTPEELLHDFQNWPNDFRQESLEEYHQQEATRQQQFAEQEPLDLPEDPDVILENA